LIQTIFSLGLQLLEEFVTRTSSIPLISPYKTLEEDTSDSFFDRGANIRSRFSCRFLRKVMPIATEIWDITNEVDRAFLIYNAT